MTATRGTLTPDELVFVQRMLPHVLAGKSFDEAAQAVLDDDQRIAAEVFDSNRTGQREGIRELITADIYKRLRG